MKNVWLLSVLVPICVVSAEAGYIQRTVDTVTWPFKKGVEVAVSHVVSKMDTPELARLRLNQARLSDAVESNWLQSLKALRDEIQARFFPVRSSGEEHIERMRLNQARLNVPVPDFPAYTLTIALWKHTVGRCF